MWNIIVPLSILILAIVLFPAVFKEGYDDYLDALLKERGYDAAKAVPTVEYNTKTGQWEAVDPKYQSYAKQLADKYGSFKDAVTAIQTAKTTSSSYETPPDSNYADKDKKLPFSQISGRTSDITPDTSASSDLDVFFQSPASKSTTEFEQLLKLLAEREAITSGKSTTSSSTPSSSSSSSSSGTTSSSSTSGTSSSSTAAADKGTDATKTSTGTSTNLPISAKDFYTQFRPLLQQDVESTVKNELEKQYANTPVLGEDPCEECY